MSINVSFTKHIKEVLKSSGFKYIRWNFNKLGTRVYIKGKRAVVVIPTVEISPPYVAPIQQSIDAYFNDLRNFLIGLSKEHKITDIFFSVGGKIPLPQWFSDWCNQNGINVHILGADDPGNIDFQNLQ